MQVIALLSMAALASAAAVKRQETTTQHEEISFYYDQSCASTGEKPYFNATFPTPSCSFDETSKAGLPSQNKTGSFLFDYGNTGTCITFYEGKCGNTAEMYRIFAAEGSGCHSYDLAFEPACVQYQAGVSECPSTPYVCPTEE